MAVLYSSLCSEGFRMDGVRIPNGVTFIYFLTRLDLLYEVPGHIRKLLTRV